MKDVLILNSIDLLKDPLLISLLIRLGVINDYAK